MITLVTFLVVVPLTSSTAVPVILEAVPQGPEVEQQAVAGWVDVAVVEAAVAAALASKSHQPHPPI